MAHGIFVTAINCMDGRVQEPVLKWMRQRFQADYVDVITEPGPDKVMTDALAAGPASIKSRLGISVNKHHSRAVAIVAHHDCAGYPVSKEEHLAALAKSVDIIKSWLFAVRIVALWVNDHWQVELIQED